jgi:ABC-type polysaccharide/polyol phosphate transport system ATPase subunit
MSWILKVENLSKLYRMGTKRSMTESFYEKLTSTVKKKWFNYEDKVLLAEATIARSENHMISESQVEDAPLGHFWALKDLSFEINAGDRVGILGQNGSGKSTLLKILSRITAPTTGQFRQRGHLISLLEVGTGFHVDLSGRENVYLNAAINGMSRKQINAKFNEIVEFSELGEHIDSPVKRYSSGMYMRLAFSVAAFLESEILLIDEVLAVGDAGFQKKCKEKMLAVANEGRTLLFVSHDMSAVQSICNSVIELSHGQIKEIKTLDSKVDSVAAIESQVENPLVVETPKIELAPKAIEVARPQKAMFIECSAPFWKDVAEKLKVNHGLSPIYWTGLSTYKDELLSTFAGLHFHDCADAKRNIPLPEFHDCSYTAFDEICQDIWKQEAQIVYDMLNRFDLSNDLTFNQRKLYFFKALIYWNAVIKKLNPSHIIFPNPPHTTYDYVIYSIAKRRNIKTILFDETAYAPYSTSYLDYRDGSLSLLEDLQSRKSDDMQTTAEAKIHIERITSSYTEAKPFREVEIENELKEEGRKRGLDSLFASLEHALKYETGQEKDFIYRKSPINTGSLVKERSKSLEHSYTDRLAQTKYYLTRLWENLLSVKRKENYMALLKNVNYSKPYIYVAFAGQPERTSNPQGDIFTEQMLMVNILANSVPQDWIVYVKEHPNQFHHAMVGHVSRDFEFYQLLSEHKNVHLIATNEDPFKLIDNAKAVATIAGTTGWEALVRGKPALVFGAAWYQHCEGVLRIKSYVDCQQAVQKIRAGYRPNKNKTESFLSSLERNGFRGLSDPLPENYHGISNAENAEAIYHEIAKYLEKVKRYAEV